MRLAQFLARSLSVEHAADMTVIHQIFQFLLILRENNGTEQLSDLLLLCHGSVSVLHPFHLFIS